MNRLIRCLARGGGLILCLLALSTRPGAAAESGASGPGGARWNALQQTLKANGFADAAIAACLEPAAQAIQAGLPAETILARIEEGASKKADAPSLEKAARARLAALQTAAGAMRDAGYGPEKKENAGLLQTAARAIESGLSDAGVRDLLARGKGAQQDRMQSILEAGESMRLGGVDDPTACQVMLDFADRNMRRSEVVRATRFVIQQNRAYAGSAPAQGSVAEGSQIRSRLWGGDGALAAAGTPAAQPGPNAARNPSSSGASIVVPSAAGIRGDGPKPSIGPAVHGGDPNGGTVSPSQGGKKKD